MTDRQIDRRGRERGEKGRERGGEGDERKYMDFIKYSISHRKIVDNFVENINFIKSWALQTHL